MQADHGVLQDVSLRITGTSRRWDALPQHPLVLGPHDGIVVSGVQAQGTAAAGLFVMGRSRFRISNVTVSDTRADGIHMTAGASNGQVDRPLVPRSVDDGVAVVSYGQDSAVTHHLTVRSPTVHIVLGGQGISAVGGEDVTYDDVQLSDAAAAAVYVATEGAPHFTRSTRRVRVLGGSIVLANRDARVDCGAVLVAAAEDEVVAVRISDLSVDQTRRSAFHQVGVRGSDLVKRGD